MEKEDAECLHVAGVNDMPKVILIEDSASRGRKLEEMRKTQVLPNPYEAIAGVRAEVDKLTRKVADMERAVSGGKRVAEKEINTLTELLMVQLLKLDAIDADGDAKVQRRSEVCRIQKFVDTLDGLKARSHGVLCSGGSNATSVNIKWETLECGVGSFQSSASLQYSPTKITHEWELFD